MVPRDFDTEETTHLDHPWAADDNLGEGHRELLLHVLEAGRTWTRALPTSGDLVIGRGEGADIVLECASVSREHVRLTVGGSLVVRDLDSANGTTLRGERLPAGVPRAIEPGDMLEVGRVMLVLQPRFGGQKRGGVVDHDYFEQRVEEECERALRNGNPLTVLRLRAPRVAPAAVGDAARGICDSIVVGSYGPDELELLLVHGGASTADSVIRRIALTLGEPDAIQWGVAHFPHDGRDAQALIGFANSQLRGESDADEVGAIVVASPVMRDLYRLVDRVAASEINVLLLGETGVGKSIVARHIHESSLRADKPYMRVCCASIAPSLIESELFGHVRGAYTGAVEERPGLIESANTGTVFLDEIGELAPQMQTKLLQVIEERLVRRVGDVTPRSVDVRFLAATNRDLEAEVKAGRFREDLYYRLNGFSIVIPPLRERPQEIAPLANRIAREVGSRGRIGAAAIELLEAYHWPGNVRELRNIIARAVIIAGSGNIAPEHLPREKMRLPDESGPVQAVESLNLRDGVRAAERQLIREALRRANGNQTDAARLLGISRQTLIARLEAYDLPRPRKRTGRSSGRGRN